MPTKSASFCTVFLVCVFLVDVAVAPTALAVATKSKDALEKTVKMLSSVKDILGPNGINIVELAPVVSSLAKTLGFLGPGVAIIGIIIDICVARHQEDEMKKQFSLLHRRFDEIDQKLAGISNRMDVQTAFGEYKKNVLDKKRSLQSANKDLSMCPEEATVQAFTSQCKQNEPVSLINKIADILNTNHLGMTTLFDAFYKSANFDRKYVHERIYFVLVDLIEIGILAQLCAQVDGKEVTQSYSDFVSNKVQSTANQIMEQLKKLDERLDKEFHVQAQMELNELIKNQGKKWPDAAAIVANMTAKYSWLGFYVNMYKEKKDDNDLAYSRIYDDSKVWFVEHHAKGLPSAFMAWTRKENANQNVALIEASKKVIEKAAEVKDVCGRSSVDFVKNLELNRNFQALQPKWIYAIFYPREKVLSKQNTHGALSDFHYCFGATNVAHVGADEYRQDVIVGFA